MADTSKDGEHQGRWLQLIIGIICMVMIANLQYGWNLFVDPMSKTQGWSRAAIGGAFSFFVLAETWLVPVESWFVDKFGPRIVVTLGGILVALAEKFKLPVHFIGVGEGVDDLAPFTARDFARAIAGIES